MCDYLSFLVGRQGEICIGKFDSHTGIVTKEDRNTYYREAEWTGDGPEYLTVRISDEDFDNGEYADWWKAQILGQFKTRSALLKKVKTGVVVRDNGSVEYYRLLRVKGEETLTGSPLYLRVCSNEKDFSYICGLELVSEYGAAIVCIELNGDPKYAHTRCSKKAGITMLHKPIRGCVRVWRKTEYAKLPKILKDLYKKAGVKRGRNRWYL